MRPEFDAVWTPTSAKVKQKILIANVHFDGANRVQRVLAQFLKLNRTIDILRQNRKDRRGGRRLRIILILARLRSLSSAGSTQASAIDRNGLNVSRRQMIESVPTYQQLLVSATEFELWF